MGFSIDDAIGIHAQALRLRSRRAEILASNIANADTPNYKSRDIDFRSLLNEQNDELFQAGQLKVTHVNHIPLEKMSVDSGEVMYRVPLQPSLDGNTVDVQVEQAKYAENSMQYLASLNFASGSIKSLLTAIRGE
jgi:flagellar basal-body rod protein FlgB